MSDGWSILVVDDELPARRRLQRLLEGLPGARLVGAVGSADEAWAICQQQTVDVLLLDINLPGSNGLALARRLKALDKPPAVIFVTAHEEHAVDAFDLAATDYLVKPLRAERLARALARIEPSKPTTPAPIALTARLGEKTRSMALAQVRVLMAEDKYTRAFSPEGELLLEDSLVSLEQRFPGHFVRVHRNALVARGHIEALIRDEQGRDRVVIEGVAITPLVARRRLGDIRQALSYHLD